jgi:WD40 repeat protein
MREAIALKQWLVGQDPPLANEIFLDVDPGAGLQAGTRWKDALRRANARCEAVICLLSVNWEASHECKVEYRTAENLNKQIFVARLEESTGDELTSEWQRCDLFGDGAKTAIDVGAGPPVQFSTEGLFRLRDSIRGAGIGADSFVWPPPEDPGRAPYRGWEPLEETDAAVFFGRDAQILRALDAVRGMRRSGVSPMFVVLGPSGTGKSSFLRAGLLPRLRREDRRFVLLDIVRPERNALIGDSGLAASICATRRDFGLAGPSLGEAKAACSAGDIDQVAAWLDEIRRVAATRLLDRGDDEVATMAPTLVLPLDQAEELFSADAGQAADGFLKLIGGLVERLNATEAGLVIAATIRTDRYEVMQTHPLLAGVGTVLFDELKPMPPTQFKEVISGPAHRSTEGGRPLQVAPDLVERLLIDAGDGADTLPMLALTMSRLYGDYGSTGELTLAHYEAMGGMRRVVQTEIDEILTSDAQQRAAQLDALRSAFIPWLATINAENDQPMRRVARWADLPPASRPLIDALVAKRLMVKDTRDGQTVVEVALESLLRQWDQLAGWLRDERKDLKDADDLERASAAWAANGHDPAWLLEGSRLTEATALANEPGFRDRLRAIHAYLNASHLREGQRRSAEEHQRQAELLAAEERARYAQDRQATAEAHSHTLRRRSRILRGVVAVAAVVAVVAVVGFVRANAAGNEANRQFKSATGQRLTTEALAMIAGTRPGGDSRALKELLAARYLTSDPDDGALYTAAVKETDKVKIIDTEGSALDVAYSPDGALVAAGERDGSVRFWDPESGQPVGEPLTGHTGAVFDVAFSPDGTRLASAGGGDDTVRIWDVKSGKEIGEPLKGATDTLMSVNFSPDGRRLASAGLDKTVRIWDADTGRSLATIATGHQDSISEVVFSPDGRRLATGSEDDSVRIWDADTGAPIGAPLTDLGDTVTGVEFSPDGRLLAACGGSGTMLWDAQTLQPVGDRMVGHTNSVFGLTFSPDGRRLATAGVDSTIRLWDVATQRQIGDPLRGHASTVFGVSFSPDGRKLASGSRDGTVRIWDTIAGQPLLGHTDEVRSVAFSPNGDRLASAGRDGSVWLWSADTGQPLRQPIVTDTQLEAVAFSPDGQNLAVGGSDGTVTMWNASNDQQVGTPMQGGSASVRSVEFSPDGKLISVVDWSGTARAFKVDTGELNGDPVEGLTGLTLSSDGRLLAFVADDSNDVYLLNRETGKQVGDDLSGHENVVRSMAFSPDGHRLATGSDDNTVRLWDTSTGKAVGQPLTGHSGAVFDIAFSPDGRRLVTGGGDMTARLWDVDSGRQFGDPLVGHTDMVISVAFSPDGKKVATASNDGTVRLWPATASAKELCAKLATNMSHKQWSDWVSPDIDYVKACPDLPVAPDSGQ